MSLKRLLASRANGARSLGPVTPEGKRRSSRNALRHGLLAQSIVLENESRDGFEALSRAFIERFRPADGVELGMVEEMIVSYWRQRRAWAIETHLIDAALSSRPVTGDQISRLAAAFTSVAGPNLALIHRYETQLHRIFQRALYNLLLLRSAAAEPESRESPDEPRDLPPAETAAEPAAGNEAPEKEPVDESRISAGDPETRTFQTDATLRNEPRCPVFSTNPQPQTPPSGLPPSAPLSPQSRNRTPGACPEPA